MNDERKRLSNLENHGLDFIDVAVVFGPHTLKHLSHGKGYIARMQAVLKAYVEAHRPHVK